MIDDEERKELSVALKRALLQHDELCRELETIEDSIHELNGRIWWLLERRSQLKAAGGK